MMQHMSLADTADPNMTFFNSESLSLDMSMGNEVVAKHWCTSIHGMGIAILPKGSALS